MKKILLTACTLMAAATAFAGIEGTYTADKFFAYDYAGSTVDIESTWSNLDEEPWEVTVTDNADGTCTIYNLFDWGSTLTATYDEAAATLTIASGTVLNEDYMTGVTGTSYDVETLIAKINEAGGWIKTSAVTDLVIKVEGDKLVAASPVVLYYVDLIYISDGYVGYVYQDYGYIFSEIEWSLEDEVDTPTAIDIVGKYNTGNYTIWSADAKIDPEDSYTNESEDAEPWTVEIAKAESGYTVTNLLDWDETVAASYDEDKNILTIPSGTVINEDYGYAITGIADIDTSIDMINQYGFVPTSVTQDIMLKVVRGNLELITPILIYFPYEASGYVGYISGESCSLYKSLELIKYNSTGISAISFDNNANVEYYNLQGMRINEPAMGQIVIKRQGAKATKMIVR